MKKTNKGFTLVELLAVIVILAIIMIIAIPAVLETMQSARKKSFKEYAMKVTNEGQKTYLADQMTSNPGSCALYKIKTDLGLNNTGDYNGYVVVKNLTNKQKIYVTLYDNEYMVYGVELSNLEGAELQRYTSVDALSENNILSVANCETYTVKTSPATYETKTETLTSTPQSSTPEVKNLLTGEKEGKNGWVGVYVNGEITECYNKEGDYNGHKMNNGNKTNYCTNKVYSEDDNVCLAAKSTECCTAEDYPHNSPDSKNHMYNYFMNENNSNNSDHTACGYAFDSTGNTWFMKMISGGELPKTGAYED